MKTDELIRMLATGAIAVDAGVAGRRLVTALGWGLAGSVLLMALGYGVRADLAQAACRPIFWIKLLVPVAAALAALQLTRQVAVPGIRITAAPIVLGGLLALAWTGTAVALLSVPPAARAALVLGFTWKTCALSITLLSAPLFMAGFWAIRTLAPTRPALAGSSAGLFAGASGAAVYALHCPEMAVPFLGIWYVLGIAIPAALGALFGQRLLRW